MQYLVTANITESDICVSYRKYSTTTRERRRERQGGSKEGGEEGKRGRERERKRNEMKFYQASLTTKYQEI